jgi:1-acyl-sn-glycerol-3-phosphate acyltransferase
MDTDDMSGTSRGDASMGRDAAGGRGAPWQAVLATVVLTILRTRTLIRVFGRLPERRGPLLILSNHQFDLDSVVVPALAMLTPPRAVRVRAVASQRLFEPGFLAPRLPVLWRTVLRDPAFARLLAALGVLPMENEPLARSLASLGAEVAARYGDLPLASVLSEPALAALPQHPDGSAGGRRLHDLWSPPLVNLRPAATSLLALREPYRGDVRRALRPRLQAQIAAVTDALHRGETVFLTPEGRITADGRLGRMRAALDHLLPAGSGRVHLAAISYDPFRRARPTMLCRLVPPALSGDLTRSLAAARPVTVSQLLAGWLVAEEPTSFGAAEAAGAVRARLAGLPDAAWVPPEMRSRPDAETSAALAAMVRGGWLAAAQGRFRPTRLRRSTHLHEAGDIFAHQANQLAETVGAAADIP